MGTTTGTTSTRRLRLSRETIATLTDVAGAPGLGSPTKDACSAIGCETRGCETNANCGADSWGGLACTILCGD